MTLGKDGPNPSRDIFIGNSSHSGVLDVGDSYEAEATVKVPRGITGQYFLTVYADLDLPQIRQRDLRRDEYLGVLIAFAIFDLLAT